MAVSTVLTDKNEPKPDIRKVTSLTMKEGVTSFHYLSLQL